MIRRLTSVIAVITLSVLLGVGGFALAAGDGKGGANRRGANSSEHGSSKGSWNGNAQWAADPERGWVRAHERQQSRDNSGSAERGKRDNGKQKGKGKAKKF